MKLPPECKLLTTGEVAALLGLTVWTLVNWRLGRQGKHTGTERGPRYLKLGGAVRYRISDVNAWLVSRCVAPKSPRRPA